MILEEGCIYKYTSSLGITFSYFIMVSSETAIFLNVLSPFHEQTVYPNRRDEFMTNIFVGEL